MENRHLYTAPNYHHWVIIFQASPAVLVAVRGRKSRLSVASHLVSRKLQANRDRVPLVPFCSKEKDDPCFLSVGPGLGPGQVVTLLFFKGAFLSFRIEMEKFSRRQLDFAENDIPKDFVNLKF